jgi:uncharacterized protein YaaQ
MKMIFAIFKDSDADNITQGLTTANFRVTRIASTGGFMRRGTVTLLIGVEDDKVDSAIKVMRDNTSPAASDEKRATIFVVPVERFEQI